MHKDSRNLWYNQIAKCELIQNLAYSAHKNLNYPEFILCVLAQFSPIVHNNLWQFENYAEERFSIFRQQVKPAAFVSKNPVEILTGIFEEFSYRLLHSINSIRNSKAPKMKCNTVHCEKKLAIFVGNLNSGGIILLQLTTSPMPL